MVVVVVDFVFVVEIGVVVVVLDIICCCCVYNTDGDLLMPKMVKLCV